MVTGSHSKCPLEWAHVFEWCGVMCGWGVDLRMDTKGTRV